MVNIEEQPFIKVEQGADIKDPGSDEDQRIQVWFSGGEEEHWEY